MQENEPGLLSMAGSLVKAVAKHAASGFAEAPPEVQAERRRLCFECIWHDDPKDACSACGCGVIGAMSFIGLDMDLKRSMATSRCPLKEPRWGPVP